MHILARAQFELSEPHLAVQNLRRSIDLRASQQDYGLTVAYLDVLEDMLTHLGRISEAAEVRRQLSKIIESMYRRHRVKEEERWAKYQADQASYYRQPSALEHSLRSS